MADNTKILNENLVKLISAIENQSNILRNSPLGAGSGSQRRQPVQARPQPNAPLTKYEKKDEWIGKKHLVYAKNMQTYLKNIKVTSDKNEKKDEWIGKKHLVYAKNMQTYLKNIKVTSDKDEKKDEWIGKKHLVYAKNMQTYLKNIKVTSDKDEKNQLHLQKTNKIMNDLLDGISKDTKTAAKRFEIVPDILQNILAKSGLKEGIFGSMNALEDIEKLLEKIKTFSSASRTGKELENKGQSKKAADSFKNLNEQIKDAGIEFKSFAELPKNIKKTGAAKEISKIFGNNVKDIDDFYNSLDSVKDGFEDFHKSGGVLPEFQKSIEKISKVIDKIFKATSGTMLQKAKALGQGAYGGPSKAKGAMGKMGAMGGMISKFMKFVPGIGQLIGGLNLLGTAVDKFKLYFEERAAIMKHGAGMLNEGTGFRAMSDAAVKFGMNVSEMAEFMGKNKWIYHVMAQNGEDYMKVLDVGRNRLEVLTGSVQGATRAFGQNMKFVHDLGVANIDTAAAADRQTDIYEKGFRKFGMGFEDFDQFRTSLRANTDIGYTLATAKASEREGIMNGILAQTKLSMEMGRTAEEAAHLAISMAAAAKKAPMERLAEGAKIAQAMGLVGMGGDKAQEYMQLKMKGTAATSDDRARMQAMQTEVSDRMLEKMGGVGNEALGYQNVAALLGLNDFFAQNAKGLAEGRAVDKDGLKAIETQEQAWNDGAQAQMKVVKLMTQANKLSEISAGYLAILATGALKNALGSVAGAVGGLLGSTGDALNIPLLKNGGAALQGLFEGGGDSSSSPRRNSLLEKAQGIGMDENFFNKYAKGASDRGMSLKQVDDFMERKIKIITKERESGEINRKIGDLQDQLKMAQDQNNTILTDALEQQIQDRQSDSKTLAEGIETLRKEQERANKDIINNTGKTAEETEKANSDKNKASTGYKICIMRSTVQPASEPQ